MFLVERLISKLADFVWMFALSKYVVVAVISGKSRVLHTPWLF